VTRPLAIIGAALMLGSATHAVHVLAAPPPYGSDDWNVMHPYKEWVTSQHDQLGRWCCDIADGRPVDAEIWENCQFPAKDKNGDCPKNTLIGTHWWVHITEKHFPGELDRWELVPDEKIIRKSNPTGVPILWLYQGKVQCFAPPDGV